MNRKDLQLVDIVNLLITDRLADTHTATIAKITKVGQKRINVRPVINRDFRGQSVELPEFVDVPIVWPKGGSSSITFPLAIDDYCILIFMERCFDNWYEGQDFQSPREFRMHDYSDGFAIVGVNTRAEELDIPDVITITGDVAHVGDMDITGDLSVTGTIEATGNITSTGGDVVAGSISLKTHTHAIPKGTDAIGGVSGVPQ